MQNTIGLDSAAYPQTYSRIADMLWRDSRAVDLFRACAGSPDAAPWEEFVRRYGLLIARTAYRVARRWTNPTPELVDDLVQECYARLCSKNATVLLGFTQQSPGSDFSYVKVFAARIVHDHFKSLRATRRDNSRTVPLSSVTEPAQSREAAERAMVLREVEKCLARNANGAAGARDRRIFLLHYRCGMTAKEISELPVVGLSAKGVESSLSRIVKRLRSAFAVAPGVEPDRKSARGAI